MYNEATGMKDKVLLITSRSLSRLKMLTVLSNEPDAKYFPLQFQATE